MILRKLKRILIILIGKNKERMKILISICARGGSKGIPGKNIKDLNGKSLIGYSIELAKKIQDKYEATIALSTDSEDIVKVAESFGVYTDYRRPAELANDKAGKLAAFYDIYEYEKKNGREYDYYLDLDVTSPLRNLEDIERTIELLTKDEQSINIFSVSPAHKNPYFNMVERNSNGYFGLCKSLDDQVLSRQSAPEVYEMNASFYLFKMKFFEEGYESIFTDHTLVYEVPHMCFDIDEVIDFEFIEFLIKNDKLDFEL